MKESSENIGRAIVGSAAQKEVKTKIPQRPIMTLGIAADQTQRKGYGRSHARAKKSTRD